MLIKELRGVFIHTIQTLGEISNTQTNGEIIWITLDALDAEIFDCRERMLQRQLGVSEHSRWDD